MIRINEKQVNDPIALIDQSRQVRQTHEKQRVMLYPCLYYFLFQTNDLFLAILFKALF